MDTTTAPSLVQEAFRTARPASRPAASLHARWARHDDEVQAAQRLRHAVFVGEMGAKLRPPPGTAPGLDADAFDRHCEHLIVLARPSDGQPEEVVGTYRVLTPAGARLAGGLYTESEFELGAWQAQRSRVAELGRSCIDPRWRTGGVILLLWSQLLQFMQRNRLDLMIGCASVPMRDGGHAAASLWERLRGTHLAHARWAVAPRLPLPLAQLRSDLPAEPPALIKGYLACGAKVLGAPAWDPDFGCADLPMMLDLADLPGAYRRRFGIPGNAHS